MTLLQTQDAIYVLFEILQYKKTEENQCISVKLTIFPIRMPPA